MQLRWKVSRSGRGTRELPWGLRSPLGLTPTPPARTQAPRQREANGRVLGYRVTLSPRRRGRDAPTICNTTHTECSFSVPAGTRRVYLSAYNAAGESAPTEVVLLERKGEGSARNLCVSPGLCSPRAGCHGVHRQGEERADSKAGHTEGDVGEVLPSPTISEMMAACPVQVSPWPGSGPCPGVSTASGCTGRHRRPQ